MKFELDYEFLLENVSYWKVVDIYDYHEIDPPKTREGFIVFYKDFLEKIRDEYKKEYDPKNPHYNYGEIMVKEPLPFKYIKNISIKIPNLKSLMADYLEECKSYEYKIEHHSIIEWIEYLQELLEKYTNLIKYIPENNIQHQEINNVLEAIKKYNIEINIL